MDIDDIKMTMAMVAIAGYVMFASFHLSGYGEIFKDFVNVQLAITMVITLVYEVIWISNRPFLGGKEVKYFEIALGGFYGLIGGGGASIIFSILAIGILKT